MADINFAPPPDPTRPAAPHEPAPGAPATADPAAIDFELIELLFFAYRDFVGEADQTLSAYGFGRAHHRVLHFVNRTPGMRVTDLLETLRITKQSLGRVLKQLVDDGYIRQTPGAVDRRQRLLHTTDKGRRLVLALAARQSARIKAALSGLDPEARVHVTAFLDRMIDRTPYHVPDDDDGA